MTKYAKIIGTGSYLPPRRVTNHDLAAQLAENGIETSDEWIVTRTGMRERRISHVSATEMAVVAARRALACAGLDPADLDLVIYGSCSADDQVHGMAWPGPRLVMSRPPLVPQNSGM